MRRISCLALAWAAACLAEPAFAAPNWTYSLAMTMGASTASESDMGLASGSLGAALQLRPWFAVGPEVGVHRLNSGTGGIYFDFPPSIEPSHAVTAGVVSRFMSPRSSGVAPFFRFETGLARIAWGEKRYVTYGQPYVQTYQRQPETALYSGIGLGLRGAWSRPAPGFELGVQYESFVASEATSFVEGRFAITY